MLTMNYSFSSLLSSPSPPSPLCWIISNLATWCSGLRGCASTRNVLLLDAVRLCAGVPTRSTVRQGDDEVRVEESLNVAPVLRSTPNQTIVADGGVGGGFLGGAPARCSESDGRIIYGVSEAITEVVLRRHENQGSYDILMNGFSLQSTTTPKKANKGVPEGHSRLTRPAWWSLARQVDSQIAIWDLEAWWSGVEKHGGV
ncbi:unnamed protein product [Prunus armeniaca]